MNNIEQSLTKRFKSDIWRKFIRGINQLSVGRLLSTMDSKGCEDFKIDHSKEFSNQWEAFISHKQEMYTKSNGILLKDL